MKRWKASLCLLLIVLLAACSNMSAAPPPPPTPIPDVQDDAAYETGTMGELAEMLSGKMGETISAGEGADAYATGINAARLAVQALGLEAQVRLGSLSSSPDEADYVRMLAQHEMFSGGVLTDQPMTVAQMDTFASAVVALKAQLPDTFALLRDSAGESTQLPDGAAIALRMAVIAYNPLAQGRTAFRYGMGDPEATSYWALAALSGMRSDEKLNTDSIEFVLANDRTHTNLGIASTPREEYARVLRHTLGVELPAQAQGLNEENGRVYLGAQPGDNVRQYPAPYRVERLEGGYLRVEADVLNNVVPAQYAGKMVALLCEAPQSALGWQVAAMDVVLFDGADHEGLPAFYKVSALSTTKGYKAEALIDADYRTVWQIGNADAQTARVTFTFSEPTAITGIALFNGDHSGNNANLQKSDKADVIGIRFTQDAEKDDLRLNVELDASSAKVGYEIAQSFGKEIITDTLVIVFYGKQNGHPRLSGVRPF